MLAIVIAAVFAGEPLHALDASGLDAYVQELAQVEGFEARLDRVLQDSLGTPYADGPLGEGPDGAYDTDPLIDFGRVDCVTFVEQSVAAATSRDYLGLFSRLQRIRYFEGHIDFEHRKHFFVSDWLAHQPFCREITGGLGVPTETVTRTISRREFFDLVKAPDLGETTPDKEVALRYIPSALGQAAEDALPNATLVVFIGRIDWLFALHCGIFRRDENGVGKLYHASSKAGRVVAVDLSDYLAAQDERYLGFAAYRLVDAGTGEVTP